MPRYLFEARYSTEGAQGLLAKGGTARKNALSQMAKALGGRLEAFYFAFGDTDAFVIAELPDNETAAALSLTVSASGAASVRTRVLITPAEMDKAAKISVPYRPPGR
jgi:uncharacterized protein with GYD domain